MESSLAPKREKNNQFNSNCYWRNWALAPAQIKSGFVWKPVLCSFLLLNHLDLKAGNSEVLTKHIRSLLFAMELCEKPTEGQYQFSLKRPTFCNHNNNCCFQSYPGLHKSMCGGQTYSLFLCFCYVCINIIFPSKSETMKKIAPRGKQPN